MDTKVMRWFVAIATSGSIRKAAEILHVAQSALSRRVLDLEAELGARLLARLPRGVALTPAGEAFLRYARDGLLRADDIQAEVGALQGLRAGTVRIAATEAFTQSLLPECIATFRKSYPGVRFEVLVGTTPETCQIVRDNRAEIGLGYSASLGSDLDAQWTAQDRLVVVVAPGHVFCSRPCVTFTDLATVPLALSSDVSPTRIQVEAAARANGLSLQPILESDSVNLLINYAMLGGAVSIFARFVAASWIDKGQLSEIRLDGHGTDIGLIVMFARRDHPLSVAADRFRLVLTDRLREEMSEAYPSGHASTSAR